MKETAKSIQIPTTNLVILIQIVFIMVLFLYIVFKKNPTAQEINYGKIQAQMEEAIQTLRNDLSGLKTENKRLYVKLDSIAFLVPSQRNKLKSINNQISKIHENFKSYNYNDSSDVRLIQRLSRL